MFAVVVVVGIAVAGLVVAWLRSPARAEYRIDRRALRQVRRRSRDLVQGHDGDPRVRRLEHLLDLAAQACRSRRRSTGLVRWVGGWRVPEPVRLETPFERRYLIDANKVLDQLAAPHLVPVGGLRDTRPEGPADQAMAEPA